jgi:copper transport protein
MPSGQEADDINDRSNDRQTDPGPGPGYSFPTRIAAMARGSAGAMRLSLKRATLPLVAGLAAFVLWAPGAGAHAILQDTSPPRGEIAKSQPKLIVFRFNEPVESSFGAVHVYDAKGREVESGDVQRPQGQKSVAIGLDSGLPKGSYTATYHVISADAHPVSGGFVFSIGKAGAVPKTVAQLTAADKVGRPTEVGFGIARGVSYAAIAFAVGALAFLIWSWLPGLSSVAGAESRWRAASERFSARLRLLLVIALAAGVVSEACQLVFQGATGAGVSFWQALDSKILREVVQTRFGTVHLLDLIAFAVFLALATPRAWAPVLRPASVGATGLAAPRFGRVELIAMGTVAGFLALSPALAGHASTQSPSGLLIPMDVLHVLAMSFWIGGLLALIAIVPAVTRALEPPDRTRLLAAILLRFSPAAFVAVCVILTTGLVQAYVHVRSVDHLIHTGYGRAVLAKMILLVALIAFGAYNQRRAIPRLRALAAGGRPPGGAGAGLRISLRSEVALLAVVIAVTSMLVSYAPPTSSSSGPFSATKTLGPLELQTTVDPATTGLNAMHVYLTNAKDGRQFTGTRELTVELSLPGKNIGPLKPKAQKAGPGHYVITGASFAPRGKWQVRITDRVSEFDEYQTTFNVPIR